MLLLGAVAACAGAPRPETGEPRPNILLVLTDDLGYSDTGPYGSEIHTPTLDRLAATGLLATSFYVAPDGGPTQAMLLTGVDHHRARAVSASPAGAVDRLDDPDPDGHLGDRVATLASLLRDAGYHTYMAGRWELGTTPGQGPATHGFERSFSLLDDVASYWTDMKVMAAGRERARYSIDGQPVEALPEDFYSTRSYTDFVIRSIAADHVDGRPFFAYLAYQAPHSPLSLPEDWLERNAGRYDVGFQAIQQRRLTAQKRKGLVEKEVVPFPGLPTVPRWEALSEEQKQRQARKMELYASLVENLDHHLGRLLDFLDEIGARDDTLVVFLSDNGASASDRGPVGTDADMRAVLTAAFPESRFENWGRPGSFVEVGSGWGQTSAVPFRMFKGTHAEGGIRSPLLVSGPGVRARGEVTEALLHVTDLAPTLLELADVSYPASYQGRTLWPQEGISLLPLWAGETGSVRTPSAWRPLLERLQGGPGPQRPDWIAFELGGDAAIRRGHWKAVRMTPPLGTGRWQLYRLDFDPAELHDRAEARPEELAELIALWQQYARAHGLRIRNAETAATEP